MDQATLLYEHPRILLDAVTIVLDLHAQSPPALTWKLIGDLAANPLVENRWDAVYKLLALVPDGPTNTIAVQRSHADSVARLAQVPADSVERAECLRRIVATRFEHAPFMSAQDLIAALPLVDAPVALNLYLSALPTHLHRLQVPWERAELERRGTSADELRARAADEVRALEAHCAPALEDGDVRSGLVGAYAAARAPADAARHWRWLVAHRRPLLPRDVDRGLAAARDLDALRRTWSDVLRVMKPKSKLAAAHGVLALHFARLGSVAEAEELCDAPAARKLALWAVLASKGEIPPGGQFFDTRKMIMRLRRLASLGMDWDGALFMLGQFSPYYKIVRGLEPKPRYGKVY